MAHRTRLLVLAMVTIIGLGAVLGSDEVRAASARAPAGAQTMPGRIRGRVVDARTGQALARARVELPSASTAPTSEPTATSILTDAEGRFDVAAPSGSVSLTVSIVGYVLARRDVRVSADATVDVVIAMTEGTGSYTEEVKVTGERFPRTESGVPTEQTLGSADLQNLKSTLADDPLRAVQTLPGVASSDDFKSEFTVRGSDFRHVGVTLDGVPSPLLLHTVHGVSDSGSIAMINSDILDSVTLLSGSYPQRYGDRTGATVEFRTREGSRDRPHVRLSASAINASGVAEGPVGRNRRGSWLVSARKSYMDWLVKRIDPTITGTFGFFDAHGKFAYDLSPAHTVHANVVVGRSRFTEADFGFGDNSLDVGYNRAVLVNTSLRSTLRPSLVVTQRVYGVAGRFRNVNPLGEELGRGEDRDLSYRLEVTSALRSGLLLEGGGHLQWLHGEGIERAFARGASVRSRYAFEFPFRGSATRQAAFAHLRWQVTPFLTIAPGARVDRWTLTGETLASPWLQAEVGLPGSFMIAGGTGIYRQAPLMEQVVGARRGVDVDAERAVHGDLGIGQRIGSWRWQAIGFVREERDMIRLPDIEPRFVDDIFREESLIARWENVLRGTSRGVELFVQRRSTSGLTGWIGYAYANTRYTDPIRRETFIADVDQRHTFNVYAAYRLSDRTNLSGSFRLGSNVPLAGYFEPITNSPIPGHYHISSVRNAVRLPTYSRLDVRAARTYAIRGGRLTLFAEAINIYNRRNVRPRRTFYLPELREAFTSTETMFPILPSAGVTVEF